MVKTKREYKVEFEERSVTISDSKGEVVHWVQDEWEEDPSIVFSIVNAVKMACEGKDIRKRIGKQEVK